MHIIRLPLIPRRNIGDEFTHAGDCVYVQPAHIVSVEEVHAQRCTVRTVDGKAWAVALSAGDTLQLGWTEAMAYRAR